MLGKRAPDISGEAWFNVTHLPALAQERVKQGELVRPGTDLAEHVILLEIWDYSCRNCIDTFSHLRDFWKKYRDQKFLVIGVHTPEFAFERDSDKVQDAIIRFSLDYPVVNDSDYATWDRYRCKVWPRLLVIDREGKIRYDQKGSGRYEQLEAAIKEALQ